MPKPAPCPAQSLASTTTAALTESPTSAAMESRLRFAGRMIPKTWKNWVLVPVRTPQISEQTPPRLSDGSRARNLPMQLRSLGKFRLCISPQAHFGANKIRRVRRQDRISGVLGTHARRLQVVEASLEVLSHHPIHVHERTHD